MPITTKPAAIAGFPPDRLNAFGDVRHVLLAAVARVRGSAVKKDDLDNLLDHIKVYNEDRFTAETLVPADISVAFANAPYADEDIIDAAEITVTINDAGDPVVEAGDVTKGLLVNGVPTALPYDAVEGDELVATATWTNFFGVQTVQSDPTTVVAGE